MAQRPRLAMAGRFTPGKMETRRAADRKPGPVHPYVPSSTPMGLEIGAGAAIGPLVVIGGRPW